jgi:hypothetical protein
VINHCRTLLLNRDGRGYVVGVPGEEYTPPEFRAVALPRALQRVWQCLFGTDPDRPYLHYRVRQYLALLPAGRHATAFSTGLPADNWLLVC